MGALSTLKVLMANYSLDEIQKALADENWRELCDASLANLVADLQNYVDNGYNLQGGDYAKFVCEISEKEQIYFKSLVKKWSETVPHKHKIQVLDVGAGPGGRTAFISNQPEVNLKAIEPSEYFYREHLLPMERAGKLPFGCVMKADMCNLPFENAVYDVVFCNAVLHHTPYFEKKMVGIEKAFSEFSRVLLPEGHLYLLTLHGHAHHFRLERFFQGLDEEQIAKLAKKNRLKVNSIEVVERAGPFGEKTRWAIAQMQKY